MKIVILKNYVFMKRITIMDDEPGAMNVFNKGCGTTGLLQIPSMISSCSSCKIPTQVL